MTEVECGAIRGQRLLRRSSMFPRRMGRTTAHLFRTVAGLKTALAGFARLILLFAESAGVKDGAKCRRHAGRVDGWSFRMSGVLACQLPPSRATSRVGVGCSTGRAERKIQTVVDFATRHSIHMRSYSLTAGC
jgi:hypothetical protein